MKFREEPALWTKVWCASRRIISVGPHVDLERTHWGFVVDICELFHTWLGNWPSGQTILETSAWRCVLRFTIFQRAKLGLNIPYLD